MPDRPVDVVDARLELPIVQMEQEVMETINENNVVVLCGETGCGKTTQVCRVIHGPCMIEMQLGERVSG